MTEAPRLTPAKRIEQSAREGRLAKALRDNLHRRKEQARAQQQIRAGEPASTNPTTTTQGGGKPPT